MSDLSICDSSPDDLLARLLGELGGAPADLWVDPRWPLIEVERLRQLLARGPGTELHAGSGRVVARSGAPVARPAILHLTPPEDHALEPATADAVERAWMDRRLGQLASEGVRVIGASRVWIGARVVVEPGVTLWPDIVLKGDTHVARGAEIRPGCWIEDTQVGGGTVILPHTVAHGARIGEGCSVGPMAHLREGTVLERKVKVGNFVEVKKSTLREGAKASHLTYLGDATVGRDTNVGAGTITCNYDGFGKHHTTIGDGAFIGSNTSLVAPVRIGDGAIVGAGSVVATDVPAESLAVERAPMKLLEGKAPAIRERNRSRANRGSRG